VEHFMIVDVRPCRPEDRTVLAAFLSGRNADRVARAGELVQWPAGHPAGISEADLAEEVPRE